MTQAFNLSQLANNLNSSGQLDATDGLTGLVPLANCGTGASNTVNTVVAGSGISVSTSGTQVTVTNTSSASGTVTSVATGNGLSGGTITTSGTLTVACPSWNSVGSYAAGVMRLENQSGSISAGGNYSAGWGNLQMMAGAWTTSADFTIGQLSGTWKWMGRSIGTNYGCGFYTGAVICRVS